MRPVGCYQPDAAEPWQVVTLVAGSKRQSLLMAEVDDEMFMIRSLNVAPKNRTVFNIVPLKSVVYVTSHKARNTLATKLNSTRSTLLFKVDRVTVSLWPRTHWQQSRPYRQQSLPYTATVAAYFVAGFGNSRLSTKLIVLNSTLSPVCTDRS